MDPQEKSSSEISTKAFAGESSSHLTSKDSHHRDSSEEVQDSTSTRLNGPNLPRKMSAQVTMQPKSVIAAPKRGSVYKVPTTAKSWTWKSYKGLLYGLTSKAVPSSKIALFDMDGTLIVNRLGRRVSDWEFFDPAVPLKLKSLANEGFRIVVVSNQLGVSLGVVAADALQKKIEQFIAAADVECTVLLATKKDNFRKPETGCWDFIQNSLNSAVPITQSQCVRHIYPVFRRRFCWKTLCTGSSQRLF